MHYTVTAKNESWEPKAQYNGLLKNQAKAQARALAKVYPDCKVFVSWFRASDGCHGYLNPDGNHDIEGQAW
jgi:hypothetical protein